MGRFAAVVPLFSMLAGPALADAPRKPNFVFVYTDDQRWDSLAVVQREQGERGRFPWMKTPSFDRMAAEGMRFRNAFVVNSLCAPSRATFLTGLYGHLNGVVNNHTPLPDSAVTHGHLLKKAGYTTGYVGKFHMDGQRGPRPGFDFSASFIGQGRYTDCPFEVDGQLTPTKGWVDDVSTDYALDFIRKNRDRPFSLVVGFKTAHGPFTPPPRRAESFAGEQARAVPNLDIPASYVRGPDVRPAAAPPAGPVNVNLGYFRCIAAADDNLGRILGALDELKLADDTVVIFTSDNGYYLGEHRLGDKRSAYDESLRIPLLVRYPRLIKPGSTSDAMVLNVDLAPTLLDLAGAEAPKAMQGRSWRPLLEGRPADWRDAYFYAYFYESGFRIPTVTAVRTNTAKLIRYPGHDEWTELFDLSADPYETRNLFGEPSAAELRARLEREYERRKEAVGFVVPAFADDPARDRPKPALNAWVVDYRFDHDENGRVVDASGQGNHGKAVGAPVVEGREGRKARRFDGRGVIEIARSASLDPAVAGWTVEAVVKPESDSGTIVAGGGQSQGYALFLEQGRPVFTVVVHNQATRVAGRGPLKAGWVGLGARITADQRLRLLVDGRVVDERRLPRTLRTPNESVQIGADLGSPVVAPAPPRFTGLVESVRIRSGEAP